MSNVDFWAQSKFFIDPSAQRTVRLIRSLRSVAKEENSDASKPTKEDHNVGKVKDILPPWRSSLRLQLPSLASYLDELECWATRDNAVEPEHLKQHVMVRDKHTKAGTHLDIPIETPTDLLQTPVLFSELPKYSDASTVLRHSHFSAVKGALPIYRTVKRH